VLGAQRGGIIWSVMREVLRLLTIWLAVGIPAAPRRPMLALRYE
jgi:hypothetical protein